MEVLAMAKSAVMAPIYALLHLWNWLGRQVTFTSPRPGETEDEFNAPQW
jgi:hypothetical protein